MKCAAVLAFLLFVSPALGQTPAPDMQTAKPAARQTPIGRWKFETGMVNTNCKLSGEMQVTKSGATGRYACKFISVQSCTANPPLEFRVQQTCVATQTGAEIAITSKIDKILSVKPSMMLPTVRSGYAPDNFEVTLSANGFEMRGMFHSLGQATVRFWRPSSDLVS